MKKLFIIASALVVAFSSCKKDDPAPTCNLDNNGILGNYKVTSILYKANTATPEVDISHFTMPVKKMTSSLLLLMVFII